MYPGLTSISARRTSSLTRPAHPVSTPTRNRCGLCTTRSESAPVCHRSAATGKSQRPRARRVVTAPKTSVQYRHRSLRTLWWLCEGDCLLRRPGHHRQDTDSPAPERTGSTDSAIAGATDQSAILGYEIGRVRVDSLPIASLFGLYSSEADIAVMELQRDQLQPLADGELKAAVAVIPDSCADDIWRTVRRRVGKHHRPPV